MRVVVMARVIHFLASDDPVPSECSWDSPGLRRVTMARDSSRLHTHPTAAPLTGIQRDAPTGTQRWKGGGR